MHPVYRTGSRRAVPVEIDGMNLGLPATAVQESAVAAGTAPMDAARSAARLRARLALAAMCLLGAILVSTGITDESAVSLDGDMPHYLMNGVFIQDLLRDLPLRAPMEWAQRYYARYPALSLGHHPILPAFAEAPLFLLFGVSVFSARLSTVCAFVLMLALWFQLIRKKYDTVTAVFSSLLLISSPGLVALCQTVLSEPFTLCLIVVSVYLMHRYCETERPVYAAAFVGSVVLSAYAKHLAIVVFPVYAFQFVSAFGMRRLLRRSTLLALAAIALGLLPLIPLTLKYSQFNIMIVTRFVTVNRLSGRNLARFAPGLWSGELRVTVPLMALAGAATLGALFRRDRRIVLFIVWVAAVFVGLAMVGVRNDRFFCYWLPAFSALGAAVLHLGSRARWRAVWMLLLTGTIGYQTWLGARDLSKPTRAAARLAGATGYEEAAQYVAENRTGETVLYSAAVDTGYFVFFVRKHDPSREMVVLRADKLLTTSRMRISSFERRIVGPEEILPMLQRFGVGYVVMEDVPHAEGPLQWLQQIVQTEDFELRRRVPIRSTDWRLANASVSIYAYRGRVPADPDATLSIGVPLMNDVIRVRLADLTAPGGR